LSAGNVDAVRVTVRVHPGAKRTEVGGRWGPDDAPALVVRVRAPAADGKANTAVLAALADALGTRSRALRLVSGATSRTKVIEVEGVEEDVLSSLLDRPHGAAR
jgi:uncharacterized protein